MLLGEIADKPEDILELCCNVDDMTGEEVGFALEQFIANGALDVFTTNIGMKKSRPGLIFSVICREADKEKFIHLLFKHTTTIGIRERRYERHTMHSEILRAETPYGPIRKKVSIGYGVRREKWEYEDLAKIAKEQNLSISEVRAIIDAHK